MNAAAKVVGADVPVYVIDGAGNICEASTCTDLPYGTEVTFRASDPELGFRFVGWTGTAECTGAALELVISSLTVDTECTANYVRRVRVSGAVAGATMGGVTASSDNPLAKCEGGSCEVDPGTAVRLVADQRWGESFLGWSGAGCGNAKTLEIMVTPQEGDVTCTAAFVRRIEVSGQAMNAQALITVTSSSQGAVCEPGSCLMDSGGNATITAPAVDGFRFAGWSGTERCTGSEPTLVFNMLTEPQQCLATYVRRFQVSGSSAGAEPPPPVIAWSTDLNAKCDGAACQVDQGGSVTLLATSAAGYRLDHWSGPRCDGETGAAVELTEVAADLACAANYTLGIAVIGAVVGAPGEVLASSPSAGAVCMAGRCDIAAGGDVTLQAPQVEGYRFTHWDGDPGCESQSASVTFTQVTQSRTCYARYAPRFIVRGVASPGEGGSVAASSASAGALCAGTSCTLDGGGEVVLTATAGANYRFSGWSGGASCAGTDPTVRVTNVAGNVTCQANFVGRITVTGVPVPAGGGSVEARSDSGASACNGGTCSLDQGSRVGLTAVPATGFQFTGWSGCSTSTERVLSFDGVRTDLMCQANFVPLRFTVTSSVVPDNSGSVMAGSSAAGASCQGGSCTVNFGSVVTLAASANAGFRFTGWSGCSTSANATLTLTDVRANTSCQANFVRLRFTVTTAIGSGQGTITTGCGASACTVDAGANVMLTATPATGFMFTSWTGCSDATTPSITVMPTGSVTCTANFAALRWTVSTAVGSGRGTIATSCNAPSCTVAQGDRVTLTATPANGFNFTGWSGCMTSNNARITVTPTSNVTCTANFAINRWTVTTAVGSGQGTAICGNGAGPCTVDQGQSITVAAQAAPNFAFTGWSGCSNSMSPSITVMPTANVTCTANFARLVWTVTTAVSAQGQGTARCGGGNGATSCTVNQGDSVTVTASPAVNFVFTNWSGCSTSTSASITVTPMADVTCTANFAAIVRTVDMAVGSGRGTATCGGNGATSCTVNQGQDVTANAVPANGFTFSGWSGCSTSTSASITVTPSSNVTCTANFAPVRVTVTTTVGTGAGTATCGDGSMSCTVDQGQNVELRAAPNRGFVFTGWSGCSISTAAEITITANANVTCTANFDRTPVTVTTNLGRGEGGTRCSAGTINGPPCTVAPGTTVTITASPADGYTFAGWTGCMPGANTATTTITPEADTTCTANFAEVQVPDFTIAATVEAGDDGTVSASTGGAECPNARCTVAPGTAVILTATSTPNSLMRFARWTCTGEAEPSTANPRTITATRNVTCTASFDPIAIEIGDLPIEGGIVN